LFLDTFKKSAFVVTIRIIITRGVSHCGLAIYI
jgi:hypothetical protein